MCTIWCLDQGLGVSGLGVRLGAFGSRIGIQGQGLEVLRWRCPCSFMLPVFLGTAQEQRQNSWCRGQRVENHEIIFWCSLNPRPSPGRRNLRFKALRRPDPKLQIEATSHRPTLDGLGVSGFGFLQYFFRALDKLDW